MFDETALSPALMPLWRALHARLSSGLAVTVVRVGPLDAEEREAYADLFGLARTPGPYVRVNVDRLDRVLRGSVGLGTREVVERTIGPVGDRAADRSRSAAEREQLWEWLRGHPIVTAQPALREWVAEVRRGGLLDRSVSTTRAVLADVLAVVDHLPAAGEPLPVFADRVLRDTHALDEGHRCGSLVLRALAAIYAEPIPVDAVGRRLTWERAGIAVDELSSTVLVAGLRTATGGAAADVVNACARAGHGAVLTLAQLKAAGVWVDPPKDVWVFENPAMVTLALSRFGAACPPIACTSGWPSAAGGLLLRMLASAGARLRYHGDFDGDGLRIAAHVVARTGAEPWRMRSEDYLSAVADGPPVGRVTPVPWDTDLAGHLIRVGTIVPEERVSARLLDEIAGLTC